MIVELFGGIGLFIAASTAAMLILVAIAVGIEALCGLICKWASRNDTHGIR